MIRQAISPRLAISSLRNIGLVPAANPSRGALLKESAQSLSPLTRSAERRQKTRRVLHEAVINTSPCASGDKSLGLFLRARRAMQQSFDYPRQHFVRHALGRRLVNEPDFARPRRRNRFRRQHE